MLTKLDWIKHEGKTAQGKKELIKHLEGGRLTLQAGYQKPLLWLLRIFFRWEG